MNYRTLGSMTENTEGDAAVDPRPPSRLRKSASLSGVIASLGLLVSSLVGFASVGPPLDTNFAERRVISDTTTVIVSDDELCLVASSLALRRTELGA
jgi:hypothetical protein